MYLVTGGKNDVFYKYVKIAHIIFFVIFIRRNGSFVIYIEAVATVIITYTLRSIVNYDYCKEK